MREGDSSAALLRELFAAIDSMDTARFVQSLTPDAVFRFGSAPPVRGRGAVSDVIGGFFSSIAGLRHALTKTIGDDGTLVCEGEVTYTRHDGSEITLPFANVFELEDGLIAKYKIYADIGPLYDS